MVRNTFVWNAFISMNSFAWMELLDLREVTLVILVNASKLLSTKISVIFYFFQESKLIPLNKHFFSQLVISVFTLFLVWYALLLHCYFNLHSHYYWVWTFPPSFSPLPSFCTFFPLLFSWQCEFTFLRKMFSCFP